LSEFPIPVRLLKRKILLYGPASHIGIFIFVYIKNDPGDHRLHIIAVNGFLHLMLIIQPLLHLLKITQMGLVTEHFIQLFIIEGYENLIHLIIKAVQLIVDFLHLLGIVLLQKPADKIVVIIVNGQRRPQHRHQQDKAE